MGLSVTGVRIAEPEDLPRLAALEAAADSSFAPLMDIRGWGQPEPGQRRAGRGTLLVIGHPAAGFAHVVDLADLADLADHDDCGGHGGHGGRSGDGGHDGHDGHGGHGGHGNHRHHLDTLCVHPDAQRRGLGRRLLHAAYGVALDAGGDRLTLTTFRDVPWNAPWYARHGFEPLSDPLPPALAQVRARERQTGLDACGPRLAMVRVIADTPAPRAAVSVLPIRDGRDGLEVFVQHRVGTMDFLPNAVVFPGGRVDPGDTALGAGLRLPPEVLASHELAWEPTNFGAAPGFGAGARGVRTTLATAVREVREETGAVIDPARLIPWDNWETPIGGPRRFDVRFLLLPVGDGGEAAAFAHTTTEAVRSEWTPIEQVRAGAEDGSLTLVSPTRVLVDELAGLGGVQAVAAQRPPIIRVRHDTCPTPARRGRFAPAGSPTPGGAHVRTG